MPIKIPKNSLQAALEAHAKTQALVAPQKTITTRETKGYIEPRDAKEKIRIIFDDSSSMAGDKIIDARAGTVQFMQYCVVNQCAVAVHCMNREALALETDLPLLASLIDQISPTGSTPMYTTIHNALSSVEGSTRLIVFSDGEPNYSDEYDATSVIDQAKRLKVPIDTVFISDGDGYDSRPKAILKYLSDSTGGIFLVFDKTRVNFAHAFKYLTPGSRHLLADKSFVERLQNGRI